MTKRAKTDIIQLKLRMREALRAKLAAAAKHNDVSLNSEIAKRLERSVTKEDSLGGPELEQVVIIMATAFAMAGQASAPNEPPAEWVKNPAAYISGMAGVLRALMIGVRAEDAHLAAETLKGVFLTEIARRKGAGK